MTESELLPIALSPPVVIGLLILLGIVIGGVVSSVFFLRHIRHVNMTFFGEKEALLQQLNSSKAHIVDIEKQQAVDRAALGVIPELKSALHEREDDLNGFQRENAMLKSRLDSEQRHYTEQLNLLKNAKEQLTKEFENLANNIFEKKQQQFTQHSQSTLETTINPLKEQLKDFRKQVEDVYHKENSERNKLIGQITELQKQTQQIGQDAVNLASALKGNSKTQGNWGEIVLERLLEESGLQKGREYETQVNLKDDTGNRRNPDVIIRLPENKDIVIDAKVSLLAYEAFCNSDDEAHRAASLKSHIASIKGHIDGLSRKNYESLESIRTLDFVFIFVPIEAAFMLALEHEPGLFQYAYDKHIILVSPTTLLATLRTVENIWRYEKQNKNAERIAKMAGGLHDQFALVVEALAELGQSISRTQLAYDKTQKRIQEGKGNLYKRIQDLETLGAKTKKNLQQLDSDDDELEEENDSISLLEDRSEV